MVTSHSQPTFTLARLFWVVTLIAAFLGTAKVAIDEQSIPVLIVVFAISLIALVAFVLVQSTPEVWRAFAIGFVAAVFPLVIVGMIRGTEPFVLVGVSGWSPNAVLPYFETTFGATLVAIVIAVIAGLFVASGRLLQRRRIGLVATAVLLLLVWMFLWDCAVHFRGDMWGKDHSVQAGEPPHHAYVCSSSLVALASTCERHFCVAPLGLTTGCACAKTWGCAGRWPADPRLTLVAPAEAQDKWASARDEGTLVRRLGT